MDVRIVPHPLSGRIVPPPSKSMAHRLVICAALAQGVSTVRNVAFSRDIEATLRCLQALGGRWEAPEEGVIRIHGIDARGAALNASRASRGLPRFDCGESGSTLRFFIPLALALCGGGVFTGGGRLMERPQQPYFDLFDEKGVFYARRGEELAVRGMLTPGTYRLAGDVSSQFFTGLLLALPLLDGPSVLEAATPLESGSYLRMTIEAMAAAGVAVGECAGDRIEISPLAYRPFEATVEADWSQAAFWYAAAFADGDVTPEGLNPDSLQGDKAISEFYWRLARPGSDAEIDLSDCPDLLPPLAVMAAVRSGTTRFTHAARLRLKESDRLASTAALLHSLGGSAEELPDGLLVRGGMSLTGGTVDGAGDHRIVMAAAVAAAACSGSVTILGAEAVEKSYPSFFDDYTALGGEVHVL